MNLDEYNLKSFTSYRLFIDCLRFGMIEFRAEASLPPETFTFYEQQFPHACFLSYLLQYVQDKRRD